VQQSSLEFDASGGWHSDAVLHGVLHAARRADPGHYDELLQDTGQALRDRWQEFFELLGADGLSGLDRRAGQIAQQIHRNGVTYNVHQPAGVGESVKRPWSLGVLPLLIEPADWQVIEAGIAQRARLLEAMLADCYGPQHLLQEGLLPPALVWRSLPSPQLQLQPGEIGLWYRLAPPPSATARCSGDAPATSAESRRRPSAWSGRSSVRPG